MKRNVDPEFEFNKEEFAEVLSKAIGARTKAAFSKDANISVSFISKYMNYKMEAAPTIAYLKKISVATTAVTYAELLKASGYDPAKHEFDMDEPMPEAAGFMSYFNSLLMSLSSVDFDWKITSKDNLWNGIISLSVEDAPFEKWYFIPISKTNIKKEDIMSSLSSKDSEMIKSGSKVSFMTTSNTDFNKITEMEFGLVSLYISVIHVDSLDGKMDEEQYAKSALDIQDERIREMVIVRSPE